MDRSESRVLYPLYVTILSLRKPLKLQSLINIEAGKLNLLALFPGKKWLFQEEGGVFYKIGDTITLYTVVKLLNGRVLDSTVGYVLGSLLNTYNVANNVLAVGELTRSPGPI